MAEMHRRKPFSTMDVNEIEQDHARAAVREKIETLKHRARDASLSLKDRLRTTPGATIAAVAVTSFVLGSVLGSRLGRALVLCAAGYGLSKIIGPGKVIDPATVMRQWTEPGKT